MSLTDDEFTCLAICGEGESLAAIGRWKPSVESLVAKGFLRHHDVANHTITDAGRKALQERNHQDDQAYHQILDHGRQVQNARSQAQISVEAAAHALAVAAKALALESGDSLHTTLMQAMATAGTRALEILHGSGRPVLPPASR